MAFFFHYYTVFVDIVLLNVLVAIISDTYTRVEEKGEERSLLQVRAVEFKPDLYVFCSAAAPDPALGTHSTEAKIRYCSWQEYQPSQHHTKP